jgi:hypothetical protein
LRCTILRHTAISAREESMTNAMTAFAIAVGSTSLVCYVLMARSQNRRANRCSSSDGSGPDGGNYGGDGWSVASWFFGHPSAIDSSGNPSDWGGGDSGGGDSGGGDGGGGDGGGGGD